MSSIRVQVTAEHIALAVPRNSGHCMIADAVKEAVPDARNVSVDIQTIRFTRNRRRYVYLTPRPCQVSLLRFDDGEQPEPFRFHLGRPAQIRAVGGHRKPTVGPPESSEVVPTVRDGKTPPLGPLLGGDRSVTRHAASDGNRRATGQIRAFGLRGMGRSLGQARAKPNAADIVAEIEDVV
jgi:hypothetical protein